jgi:hypothetical protein
VNTMQATRYASLAALTDSTRSFLSTSADKPATNIRIFKRPVAQQDQPLHTQLIERQGGKGAGYSARCQKDPARYTNIAKLARGLKDLDTRS